MTSSQLLGIFLLSSPFIAVISFSFYALGFWTTIINITTVIVIVSLIYCGVNLLHD
jgi:hypothetical protein